MAELAPTQEPTLLTEINAEAVDFIDSGLRKVLGRELVSSGEVADLLLDLRILLVGATVAQASKPFTVD